MLRGTLVRIRSEVVDKRKALAEIEASLTECGLGVDATETAIARRLEKEAQQRQRLEKLRDLADSVEVAIDTATTAAALQQHRNVVRDRQGRLERKKRDVAIFRAWNDYFMQLNGRMAGEQNEAIRQFARGFGAMASSIQERLRLVYGFGGVETRGYESTIRVRVVRGTETLRPTDYFSQSQQQTLLLGLFLTACLSQTWSSLSTVLLDDPVTHFDDLNTYALLDMIVGLLSVGDDAPQFILSTCDRRVFQLARKKLRHLGESVKFYGFEAIGSDGPVIAEIRTP